MHHSTLARRAPSPVSIIAALLAFLAGLIHFWVAPEHFAEGTPFGLFMVVVGTAQIAVGLLLLVRPSRALIVAAILLTVAVFGVFAVAYTVGVPGGGHTDTEEHGAVHEHQGGGWQREELGPAVVLSKVTELALLGALVYLVREGLPGADRRSGTGFRRGLS